LGDWYLSMAGYDWGAGNVQRAVQKTGYADFWELYKRNNLPKETKNYVPEILAAIIIANHPTQYGFDDVTLDPPVLTDTVTINYPVSLRLVSDLVGAPLDELTALNPSLLRTVTPPDASFDLHLPGGMASVYEQRIAAIPEGKRNAWRYHRVAAEDTLASVARAYHVTDAELAAANQLHAQDSIEGLEALLVPAAPAAEPAHAKLYTVRKGDTLVTIADRFGVSLNELHRWNKITGIKVQPGQRLHVAEPVSVKHTAARSHRSSGSPAGVHDAQTAPAKGATEKPATTHAPIKSTTPAAKKTPAQRSATAAGTKKSGATGAKKSHAHRRAANSKTPKAK
jgi:membrane-bound lytic murein transglycosylase D